MDHSRISRISCRNWLGINNLCEILLQNLRKLGKKIVSYLVFQQFFKKIWDIVLLYLNYAIPKIEKNGCGQLTLFYAHIMWILKYATIKAECSFFMIFSLFCWLKANFILQIVNFKFQVRPNPFGRSQLLFCKLWNLRKFTQICSKCLQKCLNHLFFFLFFFLFLLIISDKGAMRWLCRQDLWICVLQIVQNNISHLKSLMINYIII